MKPVIILISISLLLTFVHAKKYQPFKEFNSKGEVRYLILVDNDKKIHFLNRPPPEIKKVEVDDAEITFYYKSRLTSDPALLLVFNVEDIDGTDFDPNRPTMFIIHGWNNNKDAEVNTKISNALLKSGDWNIFIVDWNDKANSLYSTALGAVPGVGNITAKFIRLLMDYTGLKIENVHLAGHSLGAHVCGKVGSAFDGEIDSIVGMDPALPFVDQSDVDKRLDPSDAKYVQVIHTNAGLLGFKKPIGHADFYPNGGMNQKGCGLDAFGRCAHSRSYLYFAESITNDNFKARYCESLDDWKNGDCDENDIAYMGGNELFRTCGTFYLDTNGKEPFALG